MEVARHAAASRGVRRRWALVVAGVAMLMCCATLRTFGPGAVSARLTEQCRTVALGMSQEEAISKFERPPDGVRQARMLDTRRRVDVIGWSTRYSAAPGAPTILVDEHGRVVVIACSEGIDSVHPDYVGPWMVIGMPGMPE